MPYEDPNNEITVFAKTNFRNKEVPFGIKTDDRRRHMYIIGKTGMGKTTLMENMIIQDIQSGRGVAFADPHGDSVEKILNFIPSKRVNDVVYFNPADMEFPIAFNILESVDIRYKHLVASGLMGVFTKIWANVWSARMEYILNNCILALLDSPGNTLLGISRMLVDKKFRKKIIDNVKDPMVRTFWIDEFANWQEKYRQEAISPVLNKVGQFLSTGLVRNIVGQPKSTVDLRELMDNKKIILMNLSKGRVGEDNSALLGAMLITKLQLAALSRVDIPEEDRSDFYLYVDEFQNFATDSFATILSEARKYRLNLTIGHQYIGQLVREKNTNVRDAVFGNVGTMVCFRVGAADAEYLELEFQPTFMQTDIVNLPRGTIVLKLMINGVASEPFTAVTLPPGTYETTGNAEKVIRISRERYANPLAAVEDRIMRWMGQDFHEQVAVIAGGAASEDDDEEDEEVPAAAPAPAPKAERIPLPRQQQVEQSAAIPEAPEESELHVETPQPQQSSREPEAEFLHEFPVEVQQEITSAPVAPISAAVVPAEPQLHRIFQMPEDPKPARPDPWRPQQQGGAQPAQPTQSRQPARSGQPMRAPQRSSQQAPQRSERPQQHAPQRAPARPSQHAQQGQHPSTNNKRPSSKHPQRKENSIWDVVGKMNEQKVSVEDQKDKQIASNFAQNVRNQNTNQNVRNFQPKPSHQPSPQHPQQPSQSNAPAPVPAPAQPSASERVVLRPGESQKINLD